MITQVEASLNNRPLIYEGEDIETVLTPAQLMYGYDLPEIAEQELEEEYVETDVHKRCDTCKRSRNISGTDGGMII